MIIKHPRLIIKQHGTIKNYRYVGDVSHGQHNNQGNNGKRKYPKGGSDLVVNTNARYKN